MGVLVNVYGRTLNSDSSYSSYSCTTVHWYRRPVTLDRLPYSPPYSEYVPPMQFSQTSLKSPQKVKILKCTTVVCRTSYDRTWPNFRGPVRPYSDLSTGNRSFVLTVYCRLGIQPNPTRCTDVCRLFTMFSFAEVSESLKR